MKWGWDSFHSPPAPPEDIREVVMPWGAGVAGFLAQNECDIKKAGVWCVWGYVLDRNKRALTADVCWRAFNGRTGFDLIKMRVSEACLILLGSQGTVTGNNYFMFGLVMVTLGKSRCASGATPRRDKDCQVQEEEMAPRRAAFICSVLKFNYMHKPKIIRTGIMIWSVQVI